MTTNTIDLSQPVATIIKEHPEVKDLLIGLGFKPLSNPAMLNTVGKVTSLKAGSKLHGLFRYGQARTGHPRPAA